MIDNMNEVVKFSPFGGELVLDEVKGDTSGKLNPENDVNTVLGRDRDMYTYIPKSGCYHAKQNQVLMVLRNDPSKESAEEVMKRLKLDELAEERHFILLFPNPTKNGWNYLEKETEDNDIQYIVRCFATLPKSKGKVAGFNGMIFYIATDEVSSAFVSTLAIRSPLDVAGIMFGSYPEDYVLPQYGKAPQVAYLYAENTQAESWLSNVNYPSTLTDGIYVNKNNACIKYIYNFEYLSASTVLDAWNKLFSETRRWRNDTYGTYQPRIPFTEKGFVGHVNDTSLGVNNDFAHTWYEYIPESVRNTDKKVPLVFFFHGINCIALYGAEQSGWSNLAEKDEFIVVFPDPAIEERWNVWDDRRIPSDVDFVFALIEHMKTVHPIDESKIYVSGFSMGSMFSNALACAYPEVFAGAVACNGPNQGYLKTLDESVGGLKFFCPNTITQNLPHADETESPIHKLAEEKKGKYVIPFVQFVGLVDPTGFNPGKIFPIKSDEDGMWVQTISLMKEINNVNEGEMYDSSTASGLASPYTKTTGRFINQYWKDAEGNDLYHFIAVERMPHAVDLDGIEMGWDIVKKYHRNEDGTLGKD